MSKVPIWGGARLAARGGRRRLAALLAPLTVSAVALSAGAEPGDRDGESDRLFYEGNERMAEGKTAEACEKFERSLALLRRGGTLLNLALCREATGELTTALRLFEEALALAERDGRDDRQAAARRHIDALRASLAWLSVALAPGAEAPEIRIEVDGAALPREEWGYPRPTMPGAHIVIATAPGRRRFEARVGAARAGESYRVEIPALARLAEAAPAPPSPPPAPGAVQAPAPAPPSLSHGQQIGLSARLDVDPVHTGARAALGATLGLGDHIEIGVSALLGPDVGVEPQVTAFVLGGAPYKPLLNVGVPIFFTDGPQPGIRGAAGVEWDVNRHLGLFAQIGGVYFPSAPPGVARAVLLPAIGVQGRL